MPRLHGEDHVLQAGEAGHHARELKGTADAKPRARMRSAGSERMAEQGQFTGGVAELAPDDVQKRALARSVGTHQRVDVAFIHVDVHAIDRNEAAEVHGQPSTGEHYLPISAWRAVDVRLDHAPASRGKRYYTHPSVLHPGRAWTRLRCRRWIRARVRPGGND